MNDTETIKLTEVDQLLAFVKEARNYVAENETREKRIEEIMQEFFERANSTEAYKLVRTDDHGILYAPFELYPSVLSHDCGMKYISLLDDIKKNSMNGDHMAEMVRASIEGYFYKRGIKCKLVKFFPNPRRIDFEIRFTK